MYKATHPMITTYTYTVLNMYQLLKVIVLIFVYIYSVWWNYSNSTQEVECVIVHAPIHCVCVRVCVCVCVRACVHVCVK